MKIRFARGLAAALPAFVATLLTTSAMAQTSPQRVRITVQNTAAAGGTFLTPVFVGIDDGTFDLFNVGSAASMDLEAIAELGDTSGLTSTFNAQPGSRFAGTFANPAGPPPILAPGQTVSQDFTIELGPAGTNFLTLATMLLPSSDFFLGTSTSIDLGDLQTTPFSQTLTNIYDAGTEANAFATSPATGLFPGLPAGDAVLSPPDLDGDTIRLAGANPFGTFSDAPAGFAPGLSGLRVTVTAIPEPSSLAALGVLSAAGWITHRRRRRRNSVG